MKNFFSATRMLLLSTAVVYLASCANEPATDKSIAGKDTLLTLPEGFTATIVADSLGSARHLAVTSAGDLYVKMGDTKKGNGIVYLHDSNGDGLFDQKTGFGNYGGTGIYLADSFLYASSNEGVYRYRLDAQGKVVDPNNPATIVSGLIDRDQHNSKSIVLDKQGNIYVNIGAYSNACQQQDRTAGSPGMQPCPILDSAGGIWQFRADRLDQHFADGVRYATGLRNVVGLDWNQQANQLFVMQHGRDQLNSLFPKLFTEQQSADLPAETMYALNKGDDAGWPYIYYDQNQGKKYSHPSMGAMVKKPVVKKQLIRWSHSLPTWHRMVCYSTPAISFRKNTATVHS